MWNTQISRRIKLLSCIIYNNNKQDKYPQGLKSLQEALTYSSEEDDNILCEIHRYTAQCYFYVV